ncbi:MAG: hypothetical protein NT154_27285 [Verrucomicrobia bacterium]|nr:hypothetical protein [Verrucomicrobiota bacterium]
MRRSGRPFLLLPLQPGPAAGTVALYPAQTSRARMARTLLRWLLRASLPFGTEKVSLAISPADPFVKFLSSLAGAPIEGLPLLGILAGNPHSAGQRFLLLVFDAHQKPVAVVKAGLSQQAIGLIAQEESFLAAVPAGTRAVPRLRTTFQSSRLRALALDFLAGDSPRPRHEAALPSLLESWIDPHRKVTVPATPDWARLEKAGSGNNLLPRIAKQLRGRTVLATIHHGDFAPWNIKVSAAGEWTVLDWERGELDGIPGWDWFHYIIQSAILVEHLSTLALMGRVESLLGSAAFQQYAARGGILGCERELVLAYLLHAVEVIRPCEGLAATSELLHALAARWKKV